MQPAGICKSDNNVAPFKVGSLCAACTLWVTGDLQQTGKSLTYIDELLEWLISG